MLDRKFVESFLRVNNVTDTTPDTDVEEVLMHAGWKNEDIAAVIAMRHGAAPTETNPASQLFRPDLEFSSKQLSGLLGVDVHLDPGAFEEEYRGVPHGRAVVLRTVGLIAVIFLSLGIAVAAAATAAYVLDIRPI